MTTRPQMLAADYIRDLTRGFTTTERVLARVMRPVPSTHPNRREWWEFAGRLEHRTHTLTHPPLLTQLEDAVTGASARADEDAGTSTFESKPAAHLEAVDVLARIRREATELAHALDVPVFRKTPTAAVLLAISGQVGDEVTGRAYATIHGWWVAARLATQWDLRPFQPNGAPCPQCWHTKSLRIDLGSYLARCVECHQVWDGASAVATLAQHVKWCTDHEVTKARHWLIDEATTELVECVECLMFRDAYTSWKLEQLQAERDAEKVSA